MGGTGLRFRPGGLMSDALIDEKRQRGNSSNQWGQASQIRRTVTTARLEMTVTGLKFIRRTDESAGRGYVQAVCKCIRNAK